MTKREAAIIGAYTGVMVGNMKDMKDYISELFGGAPVFDATLSGSLMSCEIRRLAKKDFMALEVI